MSHSHTHSIQTDGRVIRWAGAYDLLLKIVTLGREGRFRARIIDVAGLQPGQRVLDVGCGTGTLALAAAAAVGPQGQVHGIDPASQMVDRARAKASRAGSTAAFQTAAIEALPFPDRSMDVVLGSLMYHHLPQSLQRAGLAEARRVLMPGGRLVLVDFGGAVDTDEMVANARAAGFDPIAVAPLGPRILFSMTAEVPSAATA